MTRYTVTYTRDALDALAREWLDALDRRAVTNAGDEIDHNLRSMQPSKAKSYAKVCVD